MLMHMHLTDDVLRILDGLVDYYLADLKFGNDHCARHVARIAPYWDVVTHAIEAAMQHLAEMIVWTLPLPKPGTTSSTTSSNTWLCCAHLPPNWRDLHQPGVARGNGQVFQLLCYAARTAAPGRRSAVAAHLNPETARVECARCHGDMTRAVRPDPARLLYAARGRLETASTADRHHVASRSTQPERRSASVGQGVDGLFC
jgi:hypothetical protein